MSKLQIKDLMSAIDRGDVNFYSKLSEEQKKSIAPWLLMRYTSSSAKYPEHYLLMVNDLVNKDFNTIRKHPEMQWKLLCLCGTGVTDFHPWIPPSKGKSKDKVEAELRKIYTELNDLEIEVLQTCFNDEQLRDILRDCGYQDKEIEEIFK